LGESGVGKTNLINAFCNLEFQKYSETTSASICNEVKYNYKNKSYTILIWDTAGQEKFRAINKFVIRDSKIVLIVYEIDNLKTFKQIDFWIKYTKENLGNDNYIMALVANKIDLFEDQVVTDEEGEEAAKKYGKPIDGHAPMVMGDDIQKYIAAGVSTDHECYDIEDALEKIRLGMKILIREGSAAKNFDTLIPLMAEYPEMLMFCSDDKHPNDLIKGHINLLVKRALEKGYKLMSVLRAASFNTVKHYHLDVGLLQLGDDADFIVVDNFDDFNVLQTYVRGRLLAENGVTLMQRRKEEANNNFHAAIIKPEDLRIEDEGKHIKVIACMDGNLITNTIVAMPKVVDGNIVSDTTRDILKMVVLDRYAPAKPAIGFINNFGLKRGAIATSVAHDSHNIVAVGCSDEDIARAVDMLVLTKGGMVACSETEFALLPLPIAGLMSLEEGARVVESYERVDQLAHEFGSHLNDPFMTLSFMALLVIPELKLSDKGLFDVAQFEFTSLVTQ
jgi:adenine deaminase